MEYTEIKRYRSKSGEWVGIIELIPDSETFPNGIPYNIIKVIYLDCFHFISLAKKNLSHIP